MYLVTATVINVFTDNCSIGLLITFSRHKAEEIEIKYEEDRAVRNPGVVHFSNGRTSLGKTVVKGWLVEFIALDARVPKCAVFNVLS